MRGLLFKEFYENRKWLILMSLFLLVNIVMFLSRILFSYDMDERLSVLSSAGMQLVIMLFIGCFQTMIFKYDERRLWSSFVSSTPTAAKGQVRSKYLFSLFLSVVGISVCYIVDMLNCAINAAQSVFQIVVLVFWIQLIFVALELPFVIRFGNKKGNNIRAFIFIGILVFAIIYGLFGDISVFVSEESFYDFAFSLLKGEIGANEMLWTNALIPYVAIALYILSYKLSCKLYQKGAESFEH